MNVSNTKIYTYKKIKKILQKIIFIKKNKKQKSKVNCSQKITQGRLDLDIKIFL